MQLDLSAYRHIVVLTGAGISVGSGLPAFRGPGGLFTREGVDDALGVDALRLDPAAVWRLFGPLRQVANDAAPNAAHHALVGLRRRLSKHQRFCLVTQNIDGLHGRAGSDDVVELHGGLRKSRCANTRCKSAPFDDPEEHTEGAPRCAACGDVLRPDIVLFGEPVPSVALWRVRRALRACDLFIAVGTSGLVSPARDFVKTARQAGARTIYVNVEPMHPRTPDFDVDVIGRAEDMLPSLFGTGPSIKPRGTDLRRPPRPSADR